eukprot:Sspe_Gene.91747::Locus_63343_Transcript_1_1_Confidence_1.000_Length_3410::g.91747::m.91747
MVASLLDIARTLGTDGLDELRDAVGTAAGVTKSDLVHVTATLLQKRGLRGEDIREAIEQGVNEWFECADLDIDNRVSWEELSGYLARSAVLGGGREEKGHERYHALPPPYPPDGVDAVCYVPLGDVGRVVAALETPDDAFGCCLLNPLSWRQDVLLPSRYVTDAVYLPKKHRLVVSSANLQVAVYDTTRVAHAVCDEWESKAVSGAGRKPRPYRHPAVGQKRRILAGEVLEAKGAQTYSTHCLLTTTVSHMALATDGSLVASGDRDGTVHIFTIPDEASTQSAPFPGSGVSVHNDTVTAVTFTTMSGGTSHLLSTSLDGTIGMLDVERKKLVTTVTTTESITGMAWSTAHQLVLVTGLRGTAHAFCPTLSRSPFILRDATKPHIGAIVSIFAPENIPNQAITADAHGLIKIWDLRKFECAQNIVLDDHTDPSAKTKAAEAVAVAAGGRVMGAGTSYAGNVKLSKAIHIPTLRRFVAFAKRASVVFGCPPAPKASWSHSGLVLGVAYVIPNATFVTWCATEVAQWDAVTGKLLNLHSAFLRACDKQEEITALAPEAGERWVIVGTSFRRVVLLHIQHGGVLKEMVLPSHDGAPLPPAKHLSFVRDEKWLVITHLKEVITVWRYGADVSLLAVLPTLLTAVVSVALAFPLLTISDSHGFRTFDLQACIFHNDYRSRATAAVPELTHLLWLPRHICTADTHGWVKLWGLRPTAPAATIVHQDGGEVCAMAYCGSTESLYIGDDQGSVTVYHVAEALADPSSKTMTHQGKMRVSWEQVESLAILPNPHMVVACVGKRVVLLSLDLQTMFGVLSNEPHTYVFPITLRPAPSNAKGEIHVRSSRVPGSEPVEGWWSPPDVDIPQLTPDPLPQSLTLSPLPDQHVSPLAAEGSDRSESPLELHPTLSTPRRAPPRVRFGRVEKWWQSCEHLFSVSEEPHRSSPPLPDMLERPVEAKSRRTSPLNYPQFPRSHILNRTGQARRTPPLRPDLRTPPSPPPLEPHPSAHESAKQPAPPPQTAKPRKAPRRVQCLKAKVRPPRQPRADFLAQRNLAGGLVSIPSRQSQGVKGTWQIVTR